MAEYMLWWGCLGLLFQVLGTQRMAEHMLWWGCLGLPFEVQEGQVLGTQCMAK